MIFWALSYSDIKKQNNLPIKKKKVIISKRWEFFLKEQNKEFITV